MSGKVVEHVLISMWWYLMKEHKNNEQRIKTLLLPTSKVSDHGAALKFKQETLFFVGNALAEDNI